MLCVWCASRRFMFAAKGCGIAVALQPLSQALQQGQKYAVIRGSAVNHDGRKRGLTAPNVNSQITLIRRARWMKTDLSPDQIDCHELHGTEMPLGDPIELQALSEVFQKRSAPLPSVRSKRIGHLESAAGIAGLIKTMISMQHGLLYSRQIAELTPALIGLKMGCLCLHLPNQPSDQPVRRAGVSSFGTTCKRAPYCRTTERWPSSRSLERSRNPFRKFERPIQSTKVLDG